MGSAAVTVNTVVAVAGAGIESVGLDFAELLKVGHIEFELALSAA
jgi:hypothetical protein